MKEKGRRRPQETTMEKRLQNRSSLEDEAKLLLALSPFCQKEE